MLKLLAHLSSVVLPALGKHAVGGVGVATLLIYLFSAENKRLCIGYDVLGAVALLVWLVQRGVSRVE